MRQSVPGSQSTGKRDKRRSRSACPILARERCRLSMALWREPVSGWSSVRHSTLSVSFFCADVCGSCASSVSSAGVEHRPGEIHERLAGEKHGDRRHDPSCGQRPSLARVHRVLGEIGALPFRPLPRAFREGFGLKRSWSSCAVAISRARRRSASMRAAAISGVSSTGHARSAGSRTRRIRRR